MEITVILCTYDRCKSLAEALRSVAGSTIPKDVEWEVLVVDNNSRDQTRQAVEEISCRYPGRFRYLFEPRQGKSHALNAGIRDARGDILVFMDDDVSVEPTWLQNLTAHLRNGEWAGAGGRILPDQTFSPPRWLSTEDPHALAPLALFDLGPQARQLAETPFGANMAFRKEVFQKYGDFRIDLGPQPGNQIRNEDTELGRRLLIAGERLWYEPSAVVYHPVSDDRIRKWYFLGWWFDKARADVRELGVSSNTKWAIAGIPLNLFRRLAVWTLRWMVTFHPAQRFSCKVKVWGKVGEIVECVHRSRDGKLCG